jgi:hypothetical protein
MIPRSVYFQTMTKMQSQIVELRGQALIFADTGELSVAKLLREAACKVREASEELASQWMSQCLTNEV